ncbi:MAG: response regulator [Desulfobacterales bacterium]|nr:response regulator [Desulfobacterales bacterium]
MIYSSEEYSEVINHHTIFFGQQFSKYISEMTSISFTLNHESFIHAPIFMTPFNMIAFAHFSGTIQGDYIIALDEEIASNLIKKYEHEMAKYGVSELKTEYSSFIKELLNIAVSRCMSELSGTFKNLSLSPGTVIYGKVEFPSVESGIIDIESKYGKIQCGFSLNLAGQKIGKTLEKTLQQLKEYSKNLEKTNKELQQEIIYRKQAEDELKKLNEELEDRVKQRTAELEKAKEAAYAAVKAKSAFLANMSHEIRTPMNGVIATADLALTLPLHPKAKRYLEIIQNSGQTLLSIINDILDFSKIEAGQLNIENIPFDLNKVIENIIGVFTWVISNKNIELIIDVDIEAPKALIGDPLRTQQILTNLLGNAVKFTPKHGTVILKITYSKKSNDNALLHFYVKDNGIGIKKEFLDTLFTPFNQADASTTRKFGGTGLGLAISRQLVELMKGNIWVESESGKGTTFFFDLPFSRQPLDRETKFIIPEEIKGIKTLIIDELLENRIILKNLLTNFGFNPELSESAAESLNILKKSSDTNHYNLIIINHSMSEMDGLTLLNMIRNGLNISVPVIILSTFGKDDSKEISSSAGVNYFLNKPFHQPSLFKAIIEVFEIQKTKGTYKKDDLAFQLSEYKSKIKGAKILLAEDNPTNQEITEAMLNDAFVITKIANNGKEAVEMISNDSFDAILMDIQMPEMDGYTATKIIRQNPKFSSLPIIAITAQAMSDDEEKCLKAGMNGYISKPINQLKLLSILSNFITTNEISTILDESNESTQASLKQEDLLPDSLTGIDIQLAIRNLCLSPKVFKKILINFRSSNANLLNEIKDAFFNENTQNILSLCHRLKGSSANIGALDISKAASELEKECKKGFPVNIDLFKQLEKNFTIAFESLKTLDDNYKPSRNKSSTTDAKQIKPLLKELNKILFYSDPKKIQELWNILKEYLEPSEIETLGYQIDNYEYDDALLSLKSIAQKRGVIIQ